MLKILFPIVSVSLGDLLPIVARSVGREGSLDSMGNLTCIMNTLIIKITTPLVLKSASGGSKCVGLVVVAITIVFFYSVVKALKMGRHVGPRGRGDCAVGRLFRVLTRGPMCVAFLIMLLCAVKAGVIDTIGACFCACVLKSLD